MTDYEYIVIIGTYHQYAVDLKAEEVVEITSLPQGVQEKVALLAMLEETTTLPGIGNVYIIDKVKRITI